MKKSGDSPSGELLTGAVVFVNGFGVLDDVLVCVLAGLDVGESLVGIGGSFGKKRER